MKSTKTFRFARPDGGTTETQAITALSAVRKINRISRVLARTINEKARHITLAQLRCRECGLMKSAHGPNLASQTFIKHEFQP